MSATDNIIACRPGCFDLPLKEAVQLLSEVGVKNVEFPAPSDGAGGEILEIAEAAGVAVTSLAIEIGLEGTYHRIGEFLAAMENLRMLNINSGTISITPKGRPIQERGDDGKPVMVQLLNVTLNVRAFILTRGGGLVD